MSVTMREQGCLLVGEECEQVLLLYSCRNVSSWLLVQALHSEVTCAHITHLPSVIKTELILSLV